MSKPIDILSIKYCLHSFVSYSIINWMCYVEHSCNFPYFLSCDRFIIYFTFRPYCKLYTVYQHAFFLSFTLSTFQPVCYLSACYLSGYLSACYLSVHLSACYLSGCLSIYNAFVYLIVCLAVHFSLVPYINLSLCVIKL